MRTKYHIEITKLALMDHFSDSALATIVEANIKQDKIKYQFQHDHFHFNGNSFNTGETYISTQEAIVIQSISNADYVTARQALGRLIHSWQDFYSHSNYVTLWLKNSKQQNAEDIIHNDETIFKHPDLQSGKSYGLIEFIALLPGISKIIKPLMPADSHAQMNLDSPASGYHFKYAYWAALKQTMNIFDNLLLKLYNSEINHKNINSFKGK